MFTYHFFMCDPDRVVICRTRSADQQTPEGRLTEDVEAAAQQAWVAIKSFTPAMQALKAARDELAAHNKSRNIVSHSQSMIADALKLMNGETL